MSTNDQNPVVGGNGYGSLSVEELERISPQGIQNKKVLDRNAVMTRTLEKDLGGQTEPDSTEEKILLAKANAIASYGDERTRHLKATNEAEEQLQKIAVLKKGMEAIDPGTTIKEKGIEIDTIGFPEYKKTMKAAKKEFLSEYGKDWTAMLTFIASCLVSVASFGYLAYTLTKHGPNVFMVIMMIFALVFALGSSSGRKIVIYLTCKETLKPGNTAKNFAIASTIVDGLFEIIGMPLLITQILGDGALEAMGGWPGVALMVIMIEVPCYIITRSKAKEALELPNIQAIRLREKIETERTMSQEYNASLVKRNKRIDTLTDWALPQTKAA